MMPNFRQKFIDGDINTLESNINSLTPEELVFLETVKSAPTITTEEFNTLQGIAAQLKLKPVKSMSITMKHERLRR